MSLFRISTAPANQCSISVVAPTVPWELIEEVCKRVGAVRVWANDIFIWGVVWRNGRAHRLPTLKDYLDSPEARNLHGLG